ncbi:helix-turn-helix domain-containing protein [Limosilactobacillus fermentum]
MANVDFTFEGYLDMKNRITELREEKGLSMRKLSESLKEKGLSLSTDSLSKYERGVRNPKIENWEKLAEFFKVPVEYVQGAGWSQDDVVHLLLFAIATRNYGFMNGPFDTEIDGGKVFKYGFDKSVLDDVDTNDLPGYKEEYEKKGDEFWKQIKKGEHVPVPNGEDIRPYLLSNIDNPTIDLVSLLDELLPDDDIRMIENTYSEINFDDETWDAISASNETFFKFKKILLENIKTLNDYAFLSTLGEGWGTMQPSPEYVIAKRLSDELQEKKFDSKIDSFKVDPYKASKKNIDAMSITSNDHKLLFEIVAHLLDENKELKKRVDQLENKLPK